MNVIFEKIFNHNPIANILIDQDSKIIMINNYALRLFNYEHHELIGQNIEVLVPIMHRKKHPGLVRDFFSNPIPKKMGLGRILYGQNKQGEEIPIEVGLTPISYEDKLYVLSSIIDITERQRAEDRFKAAVEAAPNGMLMIDHEGTIVLTNKKIEEMFEYASGELIGKPIEVLVPDEFRPHHPKFVQNFFSNPAPRAMGIGRELYGKKKFGSLLAVEIGLQPIKSDQGTFVISSVVDITRRREIEFALKEKNEELEEFAYRTSHDLKAPILSISALADCIELDLKDNHLEEILANAGRIKKISGNLKTLVENLLLLTKTDLGNEDKTPFNFVEYFETAKVKLIQQSKEKNVEIETLLTHNRELVVQNFRLTQILDNLITNAIKYSDQKKEKRSVLITTFNDAKNFHIQIKDNGLGIPKEMHDKVFTMFSRFHQNGQDGNGLGLYMVRKLSGKVGAEIKFESSAEGTIFYLKF